MRNRLVFLLPFLRFAFAGLLAFSAFAHFQSPYVFLEDVLSYRILSGWSAVWLAVLLPTAELTVSIFLFSQAVEKFSFGLCICMFSAFFVAQASTLYRGLSIDCGCFGGLVRREVGYGSVGFLACLLVLSVIGMIVARSETELHTEKV